jgi:hypothetical protein
MFRNLFSAKTNQEQYGTPWLITSHDGSEHRPFDSSENLLELLDYLCPTPERPVTLAHEKTTLVATEYSQAVRFIYAHALYS